MVYCTNCGAPRVTGSPFCTDCGHQVSARSSAPTILTPAPSPSTDPIAHPRPRSRMVVVVISLTLLLATVLLTGGIATWAALTHDTDPPAAPILPTEQPQPAIPSDVRGDPSQSFPAPLPIALASALCISAPSRDFGGTPFTYEPAKAVDGLPETAWRCDGDGIGQRLEISLAGRATLTRIGILPGYAKTDPYDGTDRYAQNRRISAVEYTFDDGSTVSHSFDTSVSARSLQWLSLPNISTSRIVITIRGSMPGETTGGQPPFDKVAISEVAVHGLMTPHSQR